MRKIKGFLDEVWREVHPTRGRVVWPTYDKVTKATWVVIVTSAIVGLIVYMYDGVFGHIITKTLFS